MSNQVLYEDGATLINLGDEVEFRGGLLTLFKVLRGRVVYLPGTSPLNPDMESGGLSWIAIDVPGEMLARRLVDPLRGNPSALVIPPSLGEESDN